MNNLDLGEAFDSWISESFVPYRGVLLERSGKGYICMGIFCLTMGDVDALLNNSISSIRNSLKKEKNASK